MKEKIIEEYDKYTRIINGLFKLIGSGLVIMLINNIFTFHDAVKLLEIKQNYVNQNTIMNVRLKISDNFGKYSYVLKNQTSNIISIFNKNEVFNQKVCDVARAKYKIRDLKYQLVNGTANLGDYFDYDTLIMAKKFMFWYESNSKTCFYKIPNASEVMLNKIASIQSAMSSQIR